MYTHDNSQALPAGKLGEAGSPPEPQEGECRSEKLGKLRCCGSSANAGIAAIVPNRHGMPRILACRRDSNATISRQHGTAAGTDSCHEDNRDGLQIPALLTLPAGHKNAQAGIPFVVLPHAGPTAHDTPGFDFLVQFLANQGYGVLQPQFRGSSGFGATFESAGLQQWGQAMQNDVNDGARWLIRQKLADPVRIAIAGASYGGNAALMGPITEPGL